MSTNNRRDFLGTVLAGATAFGISSIVSPVKLNAEPLLLESNVNDAVDWFKKLKGKKHKMVVDGTALHDGQALGWTEAFLDTYNDLGIADTELGVVYICRSMGTVMALNDALWAKYTIGERVKVIDPATKENSLRNLYYKPKEGDDIDTNSVDALQKRGVMFCVCNHALEGMAESLAAKLNLKKEDVQKEFKDAVFPGIQLVPAGIWALNHAQEMGCTFCNGG
ncbi:MAG TPA: Tat (twin-arginine translocation) pathway signal sequence containing protein [Bacteroidia bacterium]|nr:Tat (twin-arginine translocation) pathway signal sequence containing protein [Bacteroidia bacterium]